MKPQSFYIHGKWGEGAGPPFVATNPATGEMIWQGNSVAVHDVHRAVNSARTAFQDWSIKSISERKYFLERFAAKLAERKQGMATRISDEVGKPYWESLTEVDAMINKVALTFRAYEERCEERIIPQGSLQRAIRYKPHGVAAILGPFNLPGHLPNGQIVPALLAGNTVVFKPSEYTPGVGQLLVEIWMEVGLPEGVLNLVQGGKEVGMALVQHPDINGVYFVGSAHAGRAIHQFFVGKPEKILALEMGGNNPLIVTEVEDIRAAVYLALQSAFLTSGQRCTCARRMIVTQTENGDAFLKEFLSAAGRIKIGCYTETPEPFMGPVIAKGAAQKWLKVQSDLESRGGKPLLRMSPLPGHGAMLTPGVMDVTSISNRDDTEIFAPFLQVIRVKNFAEAILEANRTVYGLAAGLLSDNPKLYEQFFHSVQAGVINWNQPLTGSSSESPFGGLGRSGNHRASGYFTVDYCADPIASLEQERVQLPGKILPGLNF